MGAVDIFLLYVVGFSVILFLIVDSFRERRKTCNKAVDRDSDSAKQLVFENCKTTAFQEEGDRIEDDEGFDDWEGIERTELERVFGEAVVFVSNAIDEINGDVKLELYGLQKVVFNGPCHGSQPMVLNLPARAKWNAWQKLGSMSREMAMEKYIDILEKTIPGWTSSRYAT